MNDVKTKPQNRIGYLGPKGSWSHQASIDLYGANQDLVGLSREDLAHAYNSRLIDILVIPVTTSVVGVTPYLDDVLGLDNPIIIGEYPCELSYDLMAKAQTSFADITKVLAHPVALAEVKPWLDRELPHAERIHAVTGGAASLEVSKSRSQDIASIGPKIATEIYGLTSIREGIEKGPHNVTRWWVLGHQPVPPTGNDKTTLIAEIQDVSLANLLRAFVEADVDIITIYERPDRKSLDGHRYVIEVIGHLQDAKLSDLLAANPRLKPLGSYPRKC
ncbi:prephenate dehydratase [Pantoea sp. Tr-811]|uniref:prephenate dehydratase n=1 Tax=Pantoea sp. Tr-811 TaxID=2608361 RepID=UPI00142407BF|nr:prephenate dehydratase domain-containing protein [Pantoea sp. Tr-811]NIF30311.1 prephenate dehydratase [Pantoea sp. Tr-811]